MAQEQDIVLDKIFSKGFVRNYGANKVPDFYADKATNIRIINGGVRSRDGHNSVYSGSGTEYPQGITANETTNQLLFVYNGSVYEIDPDDGTSHNIGSIASTSRCRFINYGAYTIFLTGDQRPYWYNGDFTLTFDASLVTGNTINLNVNGSALTAVPFNTDNNTTLDDIATQLTTDFSSVISTATRNGTDTIDIVPVKGQNVRITDIVVTGGASQANGSINKLTQVTSSELDAGVNPGFGGIFSKFTIINRNDESNVVSVSRPIDLNNQGYCKDWKGTDAYTISMKGKVEGMTATLSRFWIFTDKSIEYLSPSFLDDTGSYLPTTFADGELLASPEAVRSAGDLVFYITKSRKIKSIGYRGTITEPQIETISDLEGASIQRYMEEELSEDQSQSFIHYDRKNELMKFRMTGKKSTVADVCLCWDLTNNTWIDDLGKYYSGICTFGTKQYAATAFGQEVFEDEVGNNDDGQPIEREFTTQNLSIVEPSVIKQWRGGTVAGQIGNDCEIRTRIYIDDVLQFDQKIDSDIDNPASVGGVGDEAVGGHAVGETSDSNTLVDFSKAISIGRLRSSGKHIRFTFNGGNIGQRFVLDYLGLKYKVRKRRRIKDKKFTSTIS